MLNLVFALREQGSAVSEMHFCLHFNELSISYILWAYDSCKCPVNSRMIYCSYCYRSHNAFDTLIAVFMKINDVEPRENPA